MVQHDYTKGLNQLFFHFWGCPPLEGRELKDIYFGAKIAGKGAHRSFPKCEDNFCNLKKSLGSSSEKILSIHGKSDVLLNIQKDTFT